MSKSDRFVIVRRKKNSDSHFKFKGCWSSGWGRLDASRTTVYDLQSHAEAICRSLEAWEPRCEFRVVRVGLVVL